MGVHEKRAESLKQSTKLMTKQQKIALMDELNLLKSMKRHFKSKESDLIRELQFGLHNKKQLIKDEISLSNHVLAQKRKTFVTFLFKLHERKKKK